MAQKELQVILKAKELAKHTLTLTANCKHYPKKFRYSFVDKMVIKSLNIYETLMEANRTNLNTEKEQRSELQTKAITYCDELMFYIELSQEMGFIAMNSMEYWSKMVASIKYMTIAWRSRDKAKK